MGYTHYWDFPEKITPDEVHRAAEIAREICEEPCFGQFVMNMPKDKHDWSGLRYRNQGTDKAYVSINGYCSKDGKYDLGHEPLFLQAGKAGSSFCKTNQKPYDLTVVAVLAAWEIAGLVSNTRSDGDVDNFDANWRKALEYSINECWCDEEERKELGYKDVSVKEVQDAFESALARAHQKGLLSKSESASQPGLMTKPESILPDTEPVWF